MMTWRCLQLMLLLPWFACLPCLNATSVEDLTFQNYIVELEGILANDALLNVIGAIGPWGSAQYRFHHKVHRGEKVSFQARHLNYAGGWNNWSFLLRATYWCRALHRVGGAFQGKTWHSDGSYWTCLDDLHNQGKIVYSLGSRDDTSYEQDLIKRKQDVEVFAFDCTDISPQSASLPAVLQGRLHKKQWCIDKEDYVLTPKAGDKLPFFLSVGHSYQYFSVGSVMRQLGHKTSELFIFKIDVEGWEWNVLPNVLSDASFRPNQIVMELHYAPWMDGPAGKQTPKSLIQLLLLLAKAGYRLYAVDHVTYCCVNLSFIHKPVPKF